MRGTNTTFYVLCLALILGPNCADFGDTNTRLYEVKQIQAPAPTEDPIEEPVEEEPEPSEEPEVDPAQAELPPQPYLPDTEAIQIALGVLIEGALLPVVEEPSLPEPEPLFRPRRRMDVDQLDAAIERVSGGICWTDGTGDCVNDTRLFVDLANSLGKADFAINTQEDLSPSALFQKFLGDAARFVCNQMMQRELDGETPGPILFEHVSPTDTVESNEEGVNANLSALILRFHSRHILADSPKLELWRWLFMTSSYVSNDPALGWRNVCVGLISHPDFFTY